MPKEYLPVQKIKRPEIPISGVYATDREIAASIDLSTPIANAIIKAVNESTTATEPQDPKPTLP